MNNCVIITYSRHRVPPEIYQQSHDVLKEASSYKRINIYGFDNLKINSTYTKRHNDFVMDLYLNLKFTLESIYGNPVCFCAELDVLYPKEHFESGIESVGKEPSFIHSNNNFIQKVSHEDFRRYPPNIHIFSSLCGTKETLLNHIEEKIQEYNNSGGVKWLEPGYHLNGQTYFIRFSSEFPCIELRHEWSSTTLSDISSSFSKFLNQIENISPKKIAIMCPLRTMDSQYSVAKCVSDQLQLFSRKYHEVVFITTDNFQDFNRLPSNVEVRTIPTFIKDNTDENYGLYAIKNCNALTTALSDIDVLITHDIIFIDGFLPYNVLLRSTIKVYNTLPMIHYIHSAPSVVDRSNIDSLNILLREPLINSKYVCLNQQNIDALSKMYLIDKSEIIHVPNTIDPCINFDFHPLSKEIYYDYKLWDYDILCVYPARIVQGKQQLKLVRLLSEINSYGIKSGLILLGSFTDSKETQAYLKEITSQAKKLNFESNLILSHNTLSRWCDENGYDIALGVPHKVSIDMFQLCDLFVLPSVSEGCSLVMLEAAMSKNAIILNQDLDTLKDFGGSEKSLIKKSHYISFGSFDNPKSIDLSDSEIWKDMAAKVLNASQSNSALNFFRYVRKYHSAEYVYENLLSPHI